jgi:hypothetical protein
MIVIFPIQSLGVRNSKAELRHNHFMLKLEKKSEIHSPKCQASSKIQPVAPMPSFEAWRFTGRHRMWATYFINVGKKAILAERWAKEKAPRRARICLLIGGDEGIRTLDTGLSPYAPLAGECLRPLGHVSTRSGECTCIPPC